MKLYKYIRAIIVETVRVSVLRTAHSAAREGIQSPTLRRAVAYHPVDAELVGEGAEVGAPEHVLQGHGYLASVG